MQLLYVWRSEARAYNFTTFDVYYASKTMQI